MWFANLQLQINSPISCYIRLHSRAIFLFVRDSVTWGIKTAVARLATSKVLLPSGSPRKQNESQIA